MNIETFKALDPEAKNEADVSKFFEFLDECLVREDREQVYVTLKMLAATDTVKFIKYMHGMDTSKRVIKLARRLDIFWNERMDAYVGLPTDILTRMQGQLKAAQDAEKNLSKN